MWCSTLRICPDTYLEPHLSLESKPPEGLELATTLRTLSLGKRGGECEGQSWDLSPGPGTY